MKENSSEVYVNDGFIKDICMLCPYQKDFLYNIVTPKTKFLKFD